jgi:biopolymer transport protein ExbD
MAALPALRKSIDVQLPDPNPQVQPANAKSDQIVLEVNPDGKYFINSQEVDKANLGEKIKAIYDGRPDKVIFVKGNPQSKYGDIIEAMDVARGSGVLVIGVPPKDTPGGGGAK